jgi:hypothetical protein
MTKSCVELDVITDIKREHFYSQSQLETHTIICDHQIIGYYQLENFNYDIVNVVAVLALVIGFTILIWMERKCKKNG